MTLSGNIPLNLRSVDPANAEVIVARHQQALMANQEDEVTPGCKVILSTYKPRAAVEFDSLWQSSLERLVHGRIRDLAVGESSGFGHQALDMRDVDDRNDLCVLDHVFLVHVTQLGKDTRHWPSEECQSQQTEQLTKSFFSPVHSKCYKRLTRTR